jgi:endonuclease/exonuclease/phosphatase family metal-dependent hydrolase
MARDYCVAWWNLENLFDVEGAPARPDWLADRLRQELVGWTAEVLASKLKQLGCGIAYLNDGEGPDLLGVCEVENRTVLDKLLSQLSSDLPARRYGVAHADANDERGIDVALLFDTELFQAGETFNRVILKRNATRDLFQVNLTTRPAGRPLVVIGNHWPSRSGGAFESEPYRILAGETLAYWHERILERLGRDTPIVAIGDFNDEPFDRSLSGYALAERMEGKVVSERSRNPYFFNLSWRALGEGCGTHFFDGWNVLDQALVNRPLLRAAAPLHYVHGSFAVARDPWRLKNGRPRRFSRPSAGGGVDLEGFSDHLPITFTIREG